VERDRALSDKVRYACARGVNVAVRAPSRLKTAEAAGVFFRVKRLEFCAEGECTPDIHGFRVRLTAVQRVAAIPNIGILDVHIRIAAVSNIGIRVGRVSLAKVLAVCV
jgi:hypothetical protein